MSDIDLSEIRVETLRRSFAELQKIPRFCISSDTDEQILLFKRKLKYAEIRSGYRSEFNCCEEFLIYSYLVERISVDNKYSLSLTQLKTTECSDTDLEHILSATRRIDKHHPRMIDLDNSYLIVNNGEVNWAFLVGEAKYHSVFWCESESNHFKRLALSA